MKTNRRRFIRNTALMSTAFAFSRHLPALAANKPLLSFSTLGCPKWTFAEIVKFASANGYDGIELRGISGELDLTKCAEFKPDNIQSTLRMMGDQHLKF